MYIDKLDGRITQEFFDKHSATLRLEQGAVLRKIQEVQKAVPARMDRAIDVLQLMSRASELFLQQPATEQRRLLSVVIQDASWKDQALRTTLFELTRSARFTGRKT